MNEAAAEIVVLLDLICSKTPLRSSTFQFGPCPFLIYRRGIHMYFPAVNFKKHYAHARMDNLTVDLIV